MQANLNLFYGAVARRVLTTFDAPPHFQIALPLESAKLAASSASSTRPKKLTLRLVCGLKFSTSNSPKVSTRFINERDETYYIESEKVSPPLPKMCGKCLIAGLFAD